MGPHPTVLPTAPTEPEHPSLIVKLIVNFLPVIGFDEAMLEAIFRAGKESFVECKIIRDRKDGVSRGYGFVSYGTVEDAEAAIKSLNNLKILDKTIKVSYARPGNALKEIPEWDIRCANVLVKEIPLCWTEQDLAWYVGQGRTIIRLRIVPNAKTDNGLQFAYVRFDRHAEAMDVISQLNKVHFPDHAQSTVCLDITLSRGKRVRKP